MIATRSATGALVMAMGVLGAGVVALSAGEGKVIDVQGLLTDTAGVPQDGTFDFRVAIMDAPLAGSELFAQTISGVSVANGLYSFEVGPFTTAQVQSIMNGDARYLELRIGESTVSDFAAIPPMAPRTLLTAAGYALNSDLLDGQEAAAFAAAGHTHGTAPGSIGPAELADGSVSSGKLADGAVTTEKLAVSTCADRFFYCQTNRVRGPQGRARRART